MDIVYYIFKENNFTYGDFIFNEDRFLLLQIYNYYNCQVPTLNKIVYKYKQNSNTSMGKEIVENYAGVNDVFVLTYYYLNYKLSEKMPQHIFNQILYRIKNLNINQPNYYDSMIHMIACILLINNKKLYDQIPNEYKRYLRHIENNQEIKLGNILIWDQKSLFNRFNYFLQNDKSCKKYLNNRYIKNIIQKEEKSYVSQLIREGKVE